MTEQTEIRVVPWGRSWAVTRDGKFVSQYKGKDHAVDSGKLHASSAEVGKLLIHRRDGSLERTFTFEREPD
jgi:hypothetical protein